jgi:hypothetical protein
MRSRYHFLPAWRMRSSPPIDVSQSASLVRTSISDSKKSVVSSIEVKNDAPPPVPAENTTFSASYMPIGSNTAETVAADIKAYFDGATTRGTEDAQRHRDSGCLLGAEGRCKGSHCRDFSLGGDREFFMNVRVSFEVEERGKVVRTFAVNERFSIPDGKADTQDDIARSYQKLVAKYREHFFASLDRTFTTRRTTGVVTLVRRS